MMKLILISAFVASAAALNNAEWEDMQSDNERLAADTAGKVGVMGTASYVTGPSVDAVSKSLGRTADIAKTIAGVADGIETFAGGIGDDLKKRSAAMKVNTGARKAQMKKTIAGAIATLKAKLAAQSKSLDNDYATQAKSIADATAALGKDNQKFKASIAAKNACIKKNTILKGDKCVAPTLSDKAAMAKVSHNGWTNSDGREGGYVSNRQVVFKKLSKDTHIRIMYKDNMRLHGHTSHGRWNVYICDANGNGCSDCKDPGPIQHWKYSSHQHNWWMNDHHGGTIFGLCKKSNNRDLVVGTYQLKIYINSARYDLYTGHGDYNMFMVDEVLKI
jgi:hypothetical protein